LGVDCFGLLIGRFMEKALDDARESSLAAALMMIRLGRILVCGSVVRIIGPKLI